MRLQPKPRWTQQWKHLEWSRRRDGAGRRHRRNTTTALTSRRSSHAPEIRVRSRPARSSLRSTRSSPRPPSSRPSTSALRRVASPSSTRSTTSCSRRTPVVPSAHRGRPAPTHRAGELVRPRQRRTAAERLDDAMAGGARPRGGWQLRSGPHVPQGDRQGPAPHGRPGEGVRTPDRGRSTRLRRHRRRRGRIAGRRRRRDRRLRQASVDPECAPAGARARRPARASATS